MKFCRVPKYEFIACTAAIRSSKLETASIQFLRARRILMKPKLLLVSALSPAILAVSFLETPAFAESFTQYFRDMPVRAGELCDDVVFTEGQRLASYAQSHLGQSVQVTRAYCKTDDVGDHLPKWNMVIEYDSDRRLPAVSTINYQDMNHAGYKNAAECQANMEVERAAFTKNTGLAIFTSYCSIPLFRDFDSANNYWVWHTSQIVVRCIV